MNQPVEGEEVVRLKRQGAEQAIQLALESKWEEAVALNRSIVQAAPADVDAWNRLGKALLELGRFGEAYEAYGQSLSLDPVNQIARRNLERLEGLQDQAAPRPGGTGRVAQDMFIEEVGKTGVTILQNTPVELLPTLTAGDEVYLRPGDDSINVENADGSVIGSVEAKLALRLLRLIEGGNQYAAAVKSLTEREVEMIIKETYRDPSQTRLSFPAAGDTATGRAYIKESLLRLGDEDEEEIDEDVEDIDADSGDEGNVSFSSLGEGDGDEEDEDA